MEKILMGQEFHSPALDCWNNNYKNICLQKSVGAVNLSLLIIAAVFFLLVHISLTAVLVPKTMNPSFLFLSVSSMDPW